MVAHIERAAAFGHNPAVGTEVMYYFIHLNLGLTIPKWLAPEGWLGEYTPLLLVVFFMRCCRDGGKRPPSKFY